MSERDAILARVRRGAGRRALHPGPHPPPELPGGWDTFAATLATVGGEAHGPFAPNALGDALVALVRRRTDGGRVVASRARPSGRAAGPGRWRASPRSATASQTPRWRSCSAAPPPPIAERSRCWKTTRRTARSPSSASASCCCSRWPASGPTSTARGIHCRPRRGGATTSPGSAGRRRPRTSSRRSSTARTVRSGSTWSASSIEVRFAQAPA